MHKHMRLLRGFGNTICKWVGMCACVLVFRILLCTGVLVDDASLPEGDPNRLFRVRVILLAVGGDYPATQKMSCFNQCRCHWCKEKGTSAAHIKRKAYAEFRRMLRTRVHSFTLLSSICIGAALLILLYICMRVCVARTHPARTEGSTYERRDPCPPRTHKGWEEDMDATTEWTGYLAVLSSP
jgi:hypothetical protein